MITKLYFTPQEILDNKVLLVNLPVNDPEDTPGIEDICTNLMPLNYRLGSFGTSDSISQKLVQYIWANVANQNVLCIEIKHPRWVFVNKENMYDFITDDDWEYEKAKLGKDIWSIYIDTQDRYRTLINIYNDKLNNLLAQVETDSETRFNDTPQNLPVDDGFAADNYTTTITSSKVKSDGTSVMNRIDEIQQKLRDVFADWAFEFNKLILGE